VKQYVAYVLHLPLNLLTMLLRGALFFLTLFFMAGLKAQVQFAPFAGLQSTSANYKVRDNKQTTDRKLGFILGAGIKVPFENNLYFFPSVYYSLKGYKVTLKDTASPPSSKALNNNTSIHTIEICPMFQVDLSQKNTHFFVRFGAAVDAAFAGKEKFDTINNAGQRATVNRSMVFAYTDYGHFSASANLHFGYETNRGLMVFAFYNHGIGSMNNADNGPRILHRILGISVGWLFGDNQHLFVTKPKK
jgi:hypothetical protein